MKGTSKPWIHLMNSGTVQKNVKTSYAVPCTQQVFIYDINPADCSFWCSESTRKHSGDRRSGTVCWTRRIASESGSIIGEGPATSWATAVSEESACVRFTTGRIRLWSRRQATLGSSVRAFHQRGNGVPWEKVRRLRILATRLPDARWRRNTPIAVGILKAVRHGSIPQVPRDNIRPVSINNRSAGYA